MKDEEGDLDAGGCPLQGPQVSFWELALFSSHFPLTPALSPREREQPGPALEHSYTAGLADRLTTILPLPEGEGRGEGKRDARNAAGPRHSPLDTRMPGCL